MTIKTVSLNTARVLEENLFTQNTYFYYIKHKLDLDYKLENTPNGQCIEDYLAAPTSDELLEVLPSSISKDYEEYWIEIFKDDSGYLVSYSKYNTGDLQTLHQEYNQSLVESLGLMFIFLKKEGLL